MELNANIQLVMNSFGTLFPDTSLTCFKFPDISKFSRQVVTLHTNATNVRARSETFAVAGLSLSLWTTQSIQLGSLRECS